MLNIVSGLLSFSQPFNPDRVEPAIREPSDGNPLPRQITSRDKLNGVEVLEELVSAHLPWVTFAWQGQLRISFQKS